MKKRWLRRAVWVLATLTLFGALFTWYTNSVVLAGSGGKIYTDVGTIPERPVGLVLGTAPALGGHSNPFFERRMAAADALYKAGKVKVLLVSGDNGTRGYDEPTAMRQALIQRGVPAKDIVLDYAGFRTLDSVVRAKTVFGLDRFTIVTDDFHLPRAIYIATEKNLDAIGFQTEPLPRSVDRATYVREIAARVLVWLDIHVTNRQPRFSGPPQPIILSK